MLHIQLQIGGTLAEVAEALNALNSQGIAARVSVQPSIPDDLPVAKKAAKVAPKPAVDEDDEEEEAPKKPAKAPKASAKPVVEEDEEEEEDEVPKKPAKSARVTLEQIREAIQPMAKSDRPGLRALLESFNATKVSELDPEHYAAFYKAVQAA